MTLDDGKTPDAAQQTDLGLDAISLILKQAGKTADEVAALATLDDADRSAENQFSGEAPTLSSRFANCCDWSASFPEVACAQRAAAHARLYIVLESAEALLLAVAS